MERKKIIIISIISAILSLLYIIANHYGLLRYLGIYTQSPENYIKNYKNLDKINPKTRTIISLSATPSQLSKLEPVINSLLDQTVKVDLISVTTPPSHIPMIPKKLKNALTVFKCGNDDGELNCLVSSILREGESTTKIITVGADRVYGKDFIETLLDESSKFPDKIIYENSIDYIQLEKGCVFSTHFFNSDFLDIPKNVKPNDWVNQYFKKFDKKRIEYNENYKTL